MSIDKVIRSWNDADYRATLSAEELASLEPNPAGVVELSDAELDIVRGGLDPNTTLTSITSLGHMPILPPVPGC